MEQENKPKIPRFNMNWLYITVLMGLLFVFFFSDGSSAGGNSMSKPVGYSEFQQMVAKGYASKIVAITTQPFYKLPYEGGKVKWVYAVTALDRLQNESKVVKKKIKL